METTKISKRFIPVKENEKVNFLKVDVYYSKGGVNYFTSSNEKRGIYLSVSPVKRETIGQCISESYAGFSGIKKCVLELNKYSKKTCENFTVDAETEKEIIDYVITKNNLTL